MVTEGKRHKHFLADHIHADASENYAGYCFSSDESLICLSHTESDCTAPTIVDDFNFNALWIVTRTSCCWEIAHIREKKVSSVHSAHQIIISLARLLIEIGSEFLLFKTSFCFFYALLHAANNRLFWGEEMDCGR